MKPEATGPGSGPNNGDVLLVLGASSDIGLEILRGYDHESLTVLAHYNRSREKLDRLMEEVPATTVVPLHADLADEKEVAEMIVRVREEYGHPTQILHLAAPVPDAVHFRKTQWNDFQRQLDVQLRSAVLVLGEFLPAMARARRGKIVFTLTSYTLAEPALGTAPYTTAKHALLGLMRYLAKEYAGKGICINAVSPSMVETQFLRELPEIVVEMNAQRSPRKRNATPKDIAPIVRFLLSPESDYITGANIPVTGGSAI